MPKQVFADTAYFVSLLDSSDALAASARRLTETFLAERTPLVTTEAVLIEVLNYVSSTRFRQSGAGMVASIRGNRAWEIVALDSTLILDGQSRYVRFADKNWSMTDCISMEVMVARQLTDVATSDRGFVQAGFNVLL